MFNGWLTFILSLPWQVAVFACFDCFVFVGGCAGFVCFVLGVCVRFWVFLACCCGLCLAIGRDFRFYGADVLVVSCLCLCLD